MSVNPAMIVAIDVFIVTYRSPLPPLQALIQSIVHANQAVHAAISLYLWDNNDTNLSAWQAQLNALKTQFGGQFTQFNHYSEQSNLGFGKANNRLLRRSHSEWVLLLNQDTELEADSLGIILRQAQQDAAAVAWELRQIPFEHPKIYDPSSLEVPWVSGAACLFRRSALTAVGGFDEQIFMYAEDVDLSWRLRAQGGKLRYVPAAAVWHDTYTEAGAVKPLQAIEGTLTNLCLRARFGRWSDVLTGLSMVLGEVLVPPSFPGRRRAMLGVLLRALWKIPRFRYSGRSYRRHFQPSFPGWNFAIHRDGAFYPFKRRAEWPTPLPLVSILVRTHKRPEVLREALLSIQHQTYPHIEVIVVEDGEPTAKTLIETEFSSLNIRYEATGEAVGRSKAGNRALALARGEWLNFLDDDDQLFADHIQVLLTEALQHQVLACYGWAWEVATEVVSSIPYRYEECFHRTIHKQKFSRVMLWHHNYLPIQSVLFNRQLYERWGGFAEDMDQLEDWNLWTRYALHDDFLGVEKTTSKYRVPAKLKNIAERQHQLDLAYADALERQKGLQLSVTPYDCMQMVNEYNQQQTMICITHQDLRRLSNRYRLLGWLARYRSLFTKLRYRWHQARSSKSS